MWFAAVKILKNKEAAEDAVQQVFLNIIKKISLLMSFEQSSGKVQKCVLITVRNIALENFKLTQKFVDIDINDCDLNCGTDIESEIMTKFDIDNLLKLVKGMSSVIGNVFYLRYFLNLDYKDIADTLNITVSTARLRVFYAKKMLQDKKAGEISE